MIIGLHDSDNTGFPNYALMKISAWHKARGDSVEWFMPLMRDRRNRIASRCGDYDWGWLQNKDKTSSTYFCFVNDNGNVDYWDASTVLWVRPVFQTATYREEAEACHS